MEVKEASWGKWSPWSHCKPPVNCRGHGTRTRHRFCLQDPQKPMLICRVSKGVSDLEMRMDNFALQALDLAKTTVLIYILRKCITPPGFFKRISKYQRSQSWNVLPTMEHEYFCAWLPWNYGYQTNYSFVVFLLRQKTNLTLF